MHTTFSDLAPRVICPSLQLECPETPAGYNAAPDGCSGVSCSTLHFGKTIELTGWPFCCGAVWQDDMQLRPRLLEVLAVVFAMQSHGTIGSRLL